VDRWQKEYAEKQLAPKTVARYNQILNRVIPSIGHIRMDKLQPLHLIELYNNLAEEGVRTGYSWLARPALLEQYRIMNPKITLFARSARIGTATLQGILNKAPVKQYIAERMCEAMGMTMTRGFKELPGRTTLGKRTIRHHHGVISSILNTAVVWQVISDNPAKRVKPPKAPRLEAKYLDEVQTAHLLECLQSEAI
jgi:integrase